MGLYRIKGLIFVWMSPFILVCIAGFRPLALIFFMIWGVRAGCYILRR